ncbi:MULTISPECIES: hypothetical protein [Paenibacillus]|uniref:Uncharacterized protein n=1 Tax=Paenibacillus lautus TaxID=1401 RepID=A0A1R1B2J0_PAELA|nr:hypothetical protein [Paenibacillus lautus]OME92914.1 hypothetical protein BK123_13660 [Paenibacillus lautus]
MRVESAYTCWSPVKSKKAEPAQEGFEQLLQKNKKEEEGKGKMVTVREGGYLRQYMVRPDGSKMLLSETKQFESETAASSTDLSMSLPRAGGMSLNTKEALDLLCLQAGAVGTRSIFKVFDIT